MKKKLEVCLGKRIQHDLNLSQSQKSPNLTTASSTNLLELMFILGRPLQVTIGLTLTQIDRPMDKTLKLGSRLKTITGWSTTTLMSATGRSNRWLDAAMAISQAVVEVSKVPQLTCSSMSASKRKTTNLQSQRTVFKSFKELRLT